MAKDSLYIKKGDIILKTNSVEEMDALSNILNKLPNGFLIRIGKLCASGHGNTVKIILLTCALIVGAAGIFLSRKKIKALKKKHLEPKIEALERFLGLPGDYVKKLFNDIVNRYFENATDEIKDKIAIVCYAHMVWWTSVNDKDNMARLNGCKERLLSLIDKYDDLEIGI